MPCTSAQRQYLRGLAHRLHPVVLIGAAGVSDAVLSEIDGALLHHELIKVRLSAVDRTGRRQQIAAILERSDAECVQEIGHIAVLFRRNPEQAKIKLP
jgi:RNA-binding protein